MDVHLRDLRYFVAVAEELHFTRAAERLFISQPALSRQVAKLEAELRVRLLDRNKRSVELTSAGNALLNGAKALLADWDGVRVSIAEADAASGAVLRLGMQTSVGRGIVPILQDALTERRPGWTLQLRQVTWNDPTAGVLTGESDVALCWLPLNENAELCCAELLAEPRYLAVPEGHRLGARSSVRFSEMIDEPLVALPPEAGALRDFWLANDHRSGPAPVATVASTADEALEAVHSGLGAVLISEGNVAIYQRPGVIFVPVDGIEPCTLALVWRATDDRPVVRDLIDAAQARLDNPH